MLAALPVCNIGLEAILSCKCLPDLVILIKYAGLIACCVWPQSPLQKKAGVWNLNAHKGETNSLKDWIELFLLQCSLLAACVPLSFFFLMNFVIFSLAPLSTSPSSLSLLGIFPRQVPQCFRGDGFNCSVGIGWLCGARLFN